LAHRGETISFGRIQRSLITTPLQIGAAALERRHLNILLEIPSGRRLARMLSDMNYRYASTSPSRLKELLHRDPRTSLQEIRRAHPSFQAMSWDRLSLMLDRALADEIPYPTGAAIR
jgi:hypothetical protein